MEMANNNSVYGCTGENLSRKMCLFIDKHTNSKIKPVKTNINKGHIVKLKYNSCNRSNITKNNKEYDISICNGKEQSPNTKSLETNREKTLCKKEFDIKPNENLYYDYKNKPMFSLHPVESENNITRKEIQNSNKLYLKQTFFHKSYQIEDVESINTKGVSVYYMNNKQEPYKEKRVNNFHPKQCARLYINNKVDMKKSTIVTNNFISKANNHKLIKESNNVKNNEDNIKLIDLKYYSYFKHRQNIEGEYTKFIAAPKNKENTIINKRPSVTKVKDILAMHSEHLINRNNKPEKSNKIGRAHV